MKSIFSKTIFGCLLMLVFAHLAVAQPDSSPATSPSPPNSQSINQTAPPMGDDDRLPFMQNEQTAATPAGSSAGGMLLKTVGAMLLIVGTIFFGAWSLKKFGVNFGWFQSNQAVVHDAPDLAVLNTVNLGNGRTLAVVKFGERNLLIGSTAQSFTLLADDTNEEQLAPRPNRSVAEMLAEENAEQNNAFANELTAADSRLSVFNFKQS